MFKGKTIMSVCHLWVCAETQPALVEIKSYCRSLRPTSVCALAGLMSVIHF